MKIKLRLPLVLVLSLAVSTLASTGSATRGAFPGSNGKIVFQTFDGDWEIVRAKEDGSGLMALTDNAVDDESPAWDPTGDRIAWIRNGDVWIMRADGSGTRRVTRTDRSEIQVAWAPSGDRLVVVRDMPADYDLFIVDLRGRTLARVTDTSGQGETDPSWSPNGKLIMFTGGSGANHVATIEPDGTERTQITFLGGSTYAGGWHPGSRRVVVFSNESGDYELYRLRSDGGGVVQLTDNAWDDEQPTYSPDGLSLVWIDDFDGDYEVVTALVSSPSGAKQVTENLLLDTAPDWQPR